MDRRQSTAGGQIRSASRIGRAALVVALAVAALGTAPRVSAWSAHCDEITNPNLFAGNYLEWPGLTGAKATVEWFNTSLCIQEPGFPDYSWSLSWVGLQGTQPQFEEDGFNIYQGGFAKCWSAASYSCPYNSGLSYHWWFYARQISLECGLPFNTGIVKAPKGNATAGQYVYAFDQRVVNGSLRYAFTIDGVVQNSQPLSLLNTCWPGGPASAAWTNEMLDPSDQNAGTVSNHQSYKSISYKTSTGWHLVNGSNGCDFNDNPTFWRCNYASNHIDAYEWDTRAP